MSQLTKRPRHRSMSPSTGQRISKEITRHEQLSRMGMDQLIEMGYMKPLDEWDLEELSRGQPRNRSGGFSGRKPKWMAAAAQEEIRRRFKEEAVSHLVRHFPKALDTLAGLLDEPDPNIRLKACQLLMEYAIGKPATKTEISTDNKTASLLASALVMPTGEAAHPIIEGTIVDD